VLKASDSFCLLLKTQKTIAVAIKCDEVFLQPMRLTARSSALVDSAMPPSPFLGCILSGNDSINLSRYRLPGCAVRDALYPCDSVWHLMLKEVLDVEDALSYLTHA